MSSTKTKTRKTPKKLETQSPEGATPAETSPEQDSAKTGKSTTRPGMRILSVAIPEKLARQVRLLCSVEGTSAQAIVEAALRRAVAKRLPAALADIAKTDADDGE
jgi:hypothetical protein